LIKKTWSAPDHWVPLRRAVFTFHAREGDRFTVVDESLLRECTEALATRSAADEAKIDPMKRIFSFQYIIDEFSLIGPPWVILEERGGNYDPEVDVKMTTESVVDGDDPRLKRRYGAIWEATDYVWNHLMLPAFARAISAGAVALYARRHSTSASFQRLPVDVWPLLRVVDWSNGTAFDPDSRVYFSIHAELAPISVLSARSLRNASRASIHKAIETAYDNAEAEGAKPPNIKELPAIVLALLKEEGCSASRKLIAELGSAEPHASRRRLPGKTLRSERDTPRK